MKVSFVRTACSKDRYKETEVIGDYTLVRFDPQEAEDMVTSVEASILTSEYSKEAVEAAYAEWQEERQAKNLARAIARKEREINAYDSSPAVNSFVLNGNTISWSSSDGTSPNKSVRMGLRQNIADKMAKGEENITIWLGGMSVTLPCATVEAMMCDLENYAYECFNVTAGHKKRVKELTTAEAVEAYDYTTGYPEQLTFNV